MTDHELLAEHGSGASAEAFTELVRRHLPLVLSTARRRLAAPDQADDVAQQVFTLLARKARSLPSDVILSGWLYRTTCLVAGDQNRSDHRRLQREHQSVTAMNDAQSQSDSTWREIQPLLDEAMTCLTERDRDAVVLRYFEDRSLKEVGDAMGISPDAAQKRLSRSLERLRESLARKHRVISPAALAAAITAGAIQITPTSTQAATIAATALAASSPTGLAAGSLSYLVMSTLKTLTLAALGAALVTALVLQQQNLHKAQAERDQAVAAAEATATPPPTPQGPTTGVDPELLRLRGEVARLRTLSNDVVRLTRELASLRAARAAEASRRPEADPEEQKQIATAKMNYMKGWALAAHLYAGSHGGVLPKSFEEAANLLPKEMQLPELNPDHFEFTYQGRLDTLGEPNKYIIAREKDGLAMRTERGYMRAYAFGDGHSELHFSADGNFEKWEAEHTPPTKGL